MPEYPDVEVYIECLRERTVGEPLEALHVANPFLVRSVDPPVSAAVGRVVRGLRRLGKRIVFELEGELFLVFHLMIAGRFRWRKPETKLPGRRGLAYLDFPAGRLILTEAGTKRRASLHAVQGAAGLADHDRGGLEVFESDSAAFAAAVARENHTLKRTLTDPRIFSGIGNAYSDEILHRARLSPLRLSRQLEPDEVERLRAATLAVLQEWKERLRAEVGDGFPEKVTAFREGMVAHGRYREPCPDCGTPIQRIVYAENETNYCAQCQTEGRLLADRALSRLLKDDWPKTVDELDR